MATKKLLSKCKFEVGEKVLCYEPDSTKTQVLYDSKIMKILPEEDEEGHKYLKFLIHFQGWSSKWDRYVTDEFILKDTEENRNLQKTMAQEAQLTPGGNSYRKERKNRTNPKPAEIEQAENPVVEEPMVNNIGPVMIPSSTIKVPERKLPAFDIPQILKHQIGYNCHLVHDKDALVRLPCQPNVVMLLENYLKHLARNNFSDCKTIKKDNCKLEELYKHEFEKRFKMCVEVLDGLRICFNTFLFTDLLINDEEEVQYNEVLKMKLQQPTNNLPQKVELEFGNIHIHENKDSIKGKLGNNKLSSTSQNAQSQNTGSNCSSTKSHCPIMVNDVFEKVRDDYVSKADAWKAVPDSAYNDKIKQPAVVYGVYHFLRLMEKLPEMLALTELEGEKLSIVYLYCNGLLNYLSTQTHLFGPQCYL